MQSKTLTVIQTFIIFCALYLLTTAKLTTNYDRYVVEQRAMWANLHLNEKSITEHGQEEKNTPVPSENETKSDDSNKNKQDHFNEKLKDKDGWFTD